MRCMVIQIRIPVSADCSLDIMWVEGPGDIMWVEGPGDIMWGRGPAKQTFKS